MAPSPQVGSDLGLHEVLLGPQQDLRLKPGRQDGATGRRAQGRAGRVGVVGSRCMAKDGRRGHPEGPGVEVGGGGGRGEKGGDLRKPNS